MGCNPIPAVPPRRQRDRIADLEAWHERFNSAIAEGLDHPAALQRADGYRQPPKFSAMGVAARDTIRLSSGDTVEFIGRARTTPGTYTTEACPVCERRKRTEKPVDYDGVTVAVFTRPIVVHDSPYLLPPDPPSTELVRLTGHELKEIAEYKLRHGHVPTRDPARV